MALATLTIQRTVTGIAGAAGAKTVTDDDAAIANPASVLAAQPATLTVRSSNTAGTLTMTNGGHGIVTGQVVDLYWSGGSCHGAVVGTVSGTTVPIASVEGGDNLPIATTAITVGIRTSSSFLFTGDNLTALLFSGAPAGCRSYFVVTASDDTVQYAALVPAGQLYVWDGVGTNPLAGDTVAKVVISHENTVALASGMQAIALHH